MNRATRGLPFRWEHYAGPLAHPARADPATRVFITLPVFPVPEMPDRE